jgi:hypothetical protein
MIGRGHVVLKVVGRLSDCWFRPAEVVNILYHHCSQMGLYYSQQNKMRMEERAGRHRQERIICALPL